MFNIEHLIGNTYYLKSYSNVGIYDLGNGEAILIDSGDHKKSVRDLDDGLEKMGLRVKAIYCTHSHTDHTTGNVFFKEKYGCEIYAPETENALAMYPNIEGLWLAEGLPVKRDENGDIYGTWAKVDVLDNTNIYQGFEMVSLPGHNFNMCGYKTPDDVWFIADSVISKSTFDGYIFPVFLKINQSISTCEMLPKLKGKLFVPSHDSPKDDISDLANYNAQKMRDNKALVLSMCNEESTFDEIFKRLDDAVNLRLTNDKYAKASRTVKCYLQALCDDGVLDVYLNGGRAVYKKR